jgi:hypothetical protein
MKPVLQLLAIGATELASLLGSFIGEFVITAIQKVAFGPGTGHCCVWKYDCV